MPWRRLVDAKEQRGRFRRLVAVVILSDEPEVCICFGDSQQAERTRSCDDRVGRKSGPFQKRVRVPSPMDQVTVR